MRCSRLYIRVWLIAVLVFAGACSDGSGGGEGPAGDSTSSDLGDLLHWVGKIVPVTEGTLGPGGGEVAVTEPDSLIHGAAIVLPEGALESEETIRIGRVVGSNLKLPDGAVVAGEVVNFERDTGASFLRTAEVTLPYDPILVKDAGLLTAFVYDGIRNILMPLAVHEVDTDGHTVTVSSIHISKERLNWGKGDLPGYIPASPSLFPFLLLYPVDVTREELISGSWGSDFKVKEDGFHLLNHSTYQTPMGQCLGMSGFAAFYYSFKKSAGDLREKYHDEDWWEDDEVEIMLCAEAHTSYARQWWQKVQRP